MTAPFTLLSGLAVNDQPSVDNTSGWVKRYRNQQRQWDDADGRGDDDTMTELTPNDALALEPRILELLNGALQGNDFALRALSDLLMKAEISKTQLEQISRYLAKVLPNIQVAVSRVMRVVSMQASSKTRDQLAKIVHGVCSRANDFRLYYCLSRPMIRETEAPGCHQ